MVRDDGELAPAGHAVFLRRALSEVEDEARKLDRLVAIDAADRTPVACSVGRLLGHFGREHILAA